MEPLRPRLAGPSSRLPVRPRAGDAGGIVLGWLVRVALVLAVVGVLAFDGLSVLVAEMGVEDEAGRAARSASSTWSDTHDVRQAYTTAEASLGSSASAIVPGTFRVTPDGTVSLRVERTAPTLVLHRVDRTAGLARVTADASRRFLG